MAELAVLDRLVQALLHHGSASVFHEDPLLQELSGLDLFNEVGARLQENLGDEDFALNLAHEEGGVRFMLKVGDAANEAPDFSPPEPSVL